MQKQVHSANQRGIWEGDGQITCILQVTNMHYDFTIIGLGLNAVYIYSNYVFIVLLILYTKFHNWNVYIKLSL